MRRGILLAGLVACGFGACGSDSEDAVPYKALDHYLGVSNGAGGYDPILIKGVNLGVGIPGTQPGELALDFDTYYEWFEQMGEMGVNTVRIYTLHYPRFYEALFAYNNLHPNRPLYLIQNIWLDEENPSGGFDLFGFSDHADRDIEEAVAAIHGDTTIEHRLGRAYGTYQVDASAFVLAWIFGREVYAGEIIQANARHPQDTSYTGGILRVENVTPSQVWATRRLDKILTYERDNYGVQRPVAISNWPTTDPLDHISEPHPYSGSGEIDIVWDAGEDDAVMDLSVVDASRAPAGLYASYHVYPYYPNFMYRDPEYVAAEDADGPNNYVGYIADLKAHYGTMPLLISEFGMPSSWGNAHDAPVAGFHHGGHDEVTQAEIVRRMGNNIYDQNCAGAVVFSWMDEWWKSTWINHDRTFPIGRMPLWLDVTSPEQNYGLLAYDLGSRNFGTWSETSGLGRIQEIAADFDAAFFHLRIQLSSKLTAGETLTVGYDTYDDGLGESILPGGIAQKSVRSEFSLVVSGDSAQFYVTEAYNRYGLQNDLASVEQVAHSTATDGGNWNEWRWVTNLESSSDDGAMHFPRKEYNMGDLRVKQPDEAATTLDSIVLSDNTLTIAIPWVLLSFSDPSSLEVLHDNLETEEIEVRNSQGIAVSVAIGQGETAEILETERFTWRGWDSAPVTVIREKPALAVFAELIQSHPDTPTSP